MVFRFAYPLVLYLGLPVWALFSYYFLYRKRGLVWCFSLSSVLAQAGFVTGNYKRLVPKIFRLAAIIFFLLLAARPQWVDIRSNLNVENIDIFIVLDVSGSMMLVDDLHDPRRRLTVAQEEALSFIRRRPHDRIGFGIFATDTLTLAPITDDKNFLQKVIEDVAIGTISENQTAVGKGLAMGISRLKDSVAKSKIVVLLTDGQTNVNDDFPIEKSVALAKSLGVKVYTIGIGSQRPYCVNQFGMPVAVGDGSCLDSKLLGEIAEKTGGKYFEARNPREMAGAYENIDKLEKTEQQADIFTKFDEMFWLFFICALVSLFTELWLLVFVWKCLG